MLSDVLRGARDGLLDPNTGLNQRIARINKLKNTKTSPVQTWEFDRYPLPTRIARFPALIQPPQTGRIGNLQQSKRKSHWNLEWHWWDIGVDPDYAAVATVVDAMAIVADGLIHRATIINVDEMRMDVGGFEGQDRAWTVMRFGFRVLECDEFADIDEELA